MSSTEPLRLAQPRNLGVYQRDGSTGTVPIVLAATDGVSTLKYRTDPHDGWRTIAMREDADGYCRGSVRLPAGAWHALQLRATGWGSRELLVGIGEVFLTAGQSNAANWSASPQQTQTGKVAAFDGTDWRLAHDPMPVADGTEGSVWPLLGDSLSNHEGVPVGFLCLGVGGSSIESWDPRSDSSHYDRFRKYVPLLAPYGYRAVLWHQGEADRTSDRQPYYEHLTALLSSFREDFGPVPWMVSLVGNSWVEPGLGEGARAAQQQVIDEGLALLGPDSDVIDRRYRLSNGESSHFTKDGLEWFAALWMDALKKALL